MTVSAVYDSTISRVRVDATNLGAALAATVERSTDQIKWTTVRGGIDVEVTAGTMATVDDFEFAPDVANYYRVSYVDMRLIGVGTVTHAVNASVTPGFPTGTPAAGDVLLIWAAIRNSGVGTPDTPAGWTLLRAGGNARLFGKNWAPGDVAPSVTFTGGVANADTSAQMALIRGVDLALFNNMGSSNASAQDIVLPTLPLVGTWTGGVTVIYLGWKQDDWTSVATIAGATEIGEPDTTTGDDQGIVWDYHTVLPGTAVSVIAAETFVVTGGGAAVSRGGVVAFPAVTATQSGSVTPTLGSVWIKNISRPFLNRAVTVTDWGDVEREARNGVFPIIGRTLPVAVTDLRLSRGYELVLTTATVDEAEELDLCLASGDPILVHVPADCDVPGMYAVVGNVAVSRREARSTRRYITLPLIEVTAPGPDVIGATNTWAAVIAAYPTWAALIAANATWQDVLDGVADPGDVVVD